MKIQVTQEDIFRGQSASCYRCPIALAIRRIVGDYCPVEVKADFIIVADKLYHTPNSAKEFIYNFDDGFTVDPFEFELTKVV